MSFYSVMSVCYDLLDKIWFADRGRNPREVIERIIPNENCTVLDLCCGTFSNGLPIARKNSNNRVLGLDRSEAMLKEARSKIREANLKNARLLCKDATQTGLRSESFDYIIIGLVLHECNAELWEVILDEAHRLLKKEGRLIVLDWDKQRRVSRKIKFAPLYAGEVLVNPKYFKRFYYSNKRTFFDHYGFRTERKYECNYTSVMVMKKE